MIINYQYHYHITIIMNIILDIIKTIITIIVIIVIYYYQSSGRHASRGVFNNGVLDVESANHIPPPYP